MNIELNFYCSKDEAKITGVNIVSGLDVADMGLYKNIMHLTQVVTESYVTALQQLLDAYNKPDPMVAAPAPDIAKGEVAPDPKPAPAPASKPEPKPEPKPVTMEEVRAALIEVRKTKGTDVLKACFDSVGAARLTDVDAKDYEKLLVKAKEVLNAK
jgi:hypothetical protein